MKLSISLDPDRPTDIAQARELLDELARSTKPSVAEPSRRSGVGLESIVSQLLDVDGYGRTRLGLVKMIARASPEMVTKADVYENAKAIAKDKKPGFVMGGLHKSLEASWKSLGGTGEFFHTSRRGFTMDPDVAHAVLVALAEYNDD